MLWLFLLYLTTHVTYVNFNTNLTTHVTYVNFNTNLTTHVTYVNFNTNLNLYNKKTTCIVSIKSISTHPSFIALGLLSCECEKEQLILLIIWFYLNCCKNLLNLLLIKIKSTRMVSSVVFLLYNFSLSVTPTACILCILIFQFWCYSYIKRIPHF